MNGVKLKNIKFGPKLALSYGLIIVLMCIGGFVAINTASKLSGVTAKLYKHPLAVGSAIREMDTNLVAMHRGMKDVAMSDSLEMMDKAVASVEQYNKEVESNFKTLEERFLGDKTDIVLLEKFFADWTPIRNSVIEQKKIQIENDAYEVTVNEGAPHVKKIISALDGLIAFANGKASEFRDKAQSTYESSSAADLVDKFYNHPFTVSLTAMEIKGDTMAILKDMKDLSVAASPAKVQELADNVDRQATASQAKFELLRERFLGDKTEINTAADLFSSWKEIRDKVISMRLAQVSANPGQITREEGAPHLAKLEEILHKVQKFADSKAIAFHNNAEKQASSSRNILLIIFSCAGVLGVAAALVVTRGIIGPLTKAVEFSREISSKNLTAKLDIQQKDEIGVLADALNDMSGNLRSIFQGISADTDTLSSSSTELSAIANQMESSSEQTSSKSNSVATAAAQMSTNLDSVAAASEQAAMNVSMVAAAAEEMTTTINEITTNTSKANVMTTDAAKEAAMAAEKVNELGDAADEISKVTETITEISEQTNLLALNATIEAARAGEAGKGFAVVANEIKDLAKQTAEATQEIKQKTEAVHQSTGSTVEQISRVNGIIQEVKDMTDTVATAIEEQSATTVEIAGNVNQASQGIQEVTENVSQSSQVSTEVSQDIATIDNAAKELNDSSTHVNVSSEQLSRMAENLSVMIREFKI